MSQGSLGQVFCDFLMRELRKGFPNIPQGTRIAFAEDGGGETDKPDRLRHEAICRDSRFQTEGTERKVCWELETEKNEEKPDDRKLDTVQEAFFRMVFDELERTLGDLLYIEAIEERIIRKSAQTPGQDPLVKALIGNLLDSKWLTQQYINGILEKEGLPPQEVLIQIAAQRYERRIVKTRIYFTDSYNFGGSDLKLLGTEDLEEMRFRLENLRTMRKLMEMSGENSGLVVWRREAGDCVVGVTDGENNHLWKGEVEFFGHLCWRLKKKGTVLFEYREGRGKIPGLEGALQSERWKEELKALCRQLEESGITICEERIESIAESLTIQEHGTSIVFMEGDMLEQEVKRLSEFKRAYRIEPFPILERNEKIYGLSAIDGAVLADGEGRCHGVGAILDGEMIIQGDPGRGAKYNSVSNYVTWVCRKYSAKDGDSGKKRWCFGIVFSEDKTIDIVS